MQYLTAILFSLKGRMTHTKMFLALVSIFCTTGIDERQKHFRVGCIKKICIPVYFFPGMSNSTNLVRLHLSNRCTPNTPIDPACCFIWSTGTWRYIYFLIIIRYIFFGIMFVRPTCIFPFAKGLVAIINVRHTHVPCCSIPRLIYCTYYVQISHWFCHGTFTFAVFIWLFYILRCTDTVVMVIIILVQ